MKKLDAFTRAYIGAALWSSNDESDESGGEPLDKNYSASDINEETLEKMIADCADFQERFGELIDDNEQAGHDFWLTRNRHGAGFWDGDWPEPAATKLTEGAHEYGEFNLYLGDEDEDGEIEIHGTPLEEKTSSARSLRRLGEHHVSDFSTLPELVKHAHTEGATHVSGSGPETKLYYPRGGTHPYEEARVWRKGGYWHGEGPSARKGVASLPRGATAISGERSRRAAELKAPQFHSDVTAAIESWNRGDAYRDGSLRTLIDTGLVARGRRGWEPTAAGHRRGLSMGHLGRGVVNARRSEPQRRWGPCRFCGATGWTTSAWKYGNPLYHHDRPQGGQCLQALKAEKAGKTRETPRAPRSAHHRTRA